MASASAASSLCGSAFGSKTPIIMRICAFSPWPAPTTVFFTWLGAYSATGNPARAGLSVAEYAPNLVKKTIIGAGHGEKAQIRMMIGVLLPKADPQSEDAADALAIAICHAHHRTSLVMKAATS